MNHEYYMRRCLQLATQGLGRVAPNPMVGAVIVKDGLVISEGYHRNFGGAHAEVEAFQKLKDPLRARGATLYVNLEPCSHFGKTPPCSDLVISYGIKKVVVASIDPNPLVAGSGLAKLKTAGLETITEICDKESYLLNRRFFTFHSLNRPYVVLKWAESFDGYMDRTREAKSAKGINWISHPETAKLVHLWRNQEQAILIGGNTLRNDNPSLTVREVSGTSPTRIVLSPNGHIPTDSSMFLDGQPVLLFSNQKHGLPSHVENVKVRESAPAKILANVCSELYKRGIISILVEGGSATIQSFISAGLWDEARILQSPLRLAHGLKAPTLTGKVLSQHYYGEDYVSIVLKQ